MKVSDAKTHEHNQIPTEINLTTAGLLGSTVSYQQWDTVMYHYVREPPKPMQPPSRIGAYSAILNKQHQVDHQPPQRHPFHIVTCSTASTSTNCTTSPSPESTGTAAIRNDETNRCSPQTREQILLCQRPRRALFVQKDHPLTSQSLKRLLILVFLKLCVVNQH